MKKFTTVTLIALGILFLGFLGGNVDEVNKSAYNSTIKPMMADPGGGGA